MHTCSSDESKQSWENSPSNSEKNLNISEDKPYSDEVKIKTEPDTDSESERQEIDSPKRRFSRDTRTGEEEPPFKMSRQTESPNGQTSRKLHPDPLDLLSRAFPNHCKNVLEMVLQGCNGNVVQAIECLLTNQEKNKPLLPIPMPLLAGYPRDIHPGMHPPMLYRKENFPHTFHQAIPVNCRFPPPPPLFKPKAPTSPGYGFAMENILPSPDSSKPTKEELNRFCTHCGKKANNNDNFCAFCGQKLCP